VARIKHFAGRSAPLVATLQQYARKAQQLNLWLDCDREGEAIAFEVVSICTEANPRLVIYRARFSAVTPDEVRHAATHLAIPNKLLSDSVAYRQEVDYRLGCAFTVFQTVALQERKLIEGSGRYVSFGPCQLPTLGFVVFRALEIKEFVPENFY
jgi:DNA topoisomerase-3